MNVFYENLITPQKVRSGVTRKPVPQPPCQFTIYK
jgi:hypothetical protein